MEDTIAKPFWLIFYICGNVTLALSRKLYISVTNLSKCALGLKLYSDGWHPVKNVAR